MDALERLSFSVRQAVNLIAALRRERRELKEELQRLFAEKEEALRAAARQWEQAQRELAQAREKSSAAPAPAPQDAVEREQERRRLKALERERAQLKRKLEEIYADLDNLRLR